MPTLNPRDELQPERAVKGFRRHQIAGVQASLEHAHGSEYPKRPSGARAQKRVLDGLLEELTTSHPILPGRGTLRRVIQILGISGSLRSVSRNTILLRAAASLTPHGTRINLYAGIADLPHFNPDLEETEPAALMDFRAQLRASHAVLICSPEYAHGVPGALKNALDWVVGSGEFSGKPVGLLNASLRANHAQESLAETLRTMDARVIPEACVRVPLPAEITEAGIVSSPEVSGALRAAIRALIETVEDSV